MSDRARAPRRGDSILVVALLVVLVSGVVIGLVVGGSRRSQPGDDAATSPAPTPPSAAGEQPSEDAPTEEADPPPPPRLTPIAPPGRLQAVAVELQPIASLDVPTAAGSRSGDPALYITERAGRLRVVRDGALVPEPLLDLSEEVVTEGEQGLLDLAFSPSGEHLYLSYTGLDGHLRVHELRMGESGPDPASRREVIVIEQQGPHHNGGGLAFGHDGMLYIGTGDGGLGGDPEDDAQRRDTLRGGVLRIDPRGGDPYAVPPDNPFVDDPDGADELFLYGLRNPWRLSVDRATGDLWIGEVGHDARDEINLHPAGTPGGANYGWIRVEGRAPFQDQPPPDEPLTWPLYEYSHGEGCAITGGYVYRGQAIPELQGAYVFGDFCAGWVRALVQEDGQVVAERDLGVRLGGLVSFGEDADGELYLASSNGEVAKLVPAGAATEEPTAAQTPDG